MTVADARALNWRYLLPEEPDEPVVLDQAAAALHGRLSDALTGAPWPALAVPDLTAWTADSSPRTVLRELATSVAADGWLCVGFPNRLLPGRSRGAIGLRAATSALSAAGLHREGVYLPLPDHRHPAVLVDARHPGQLDYVFRHTFLSYRPGTSASAWLGRRLLVVARTVAVRVPHSVRVRFAPAYVVIARRSP